MVCKVRDGDGKGVIVLCLGGDCGCGSKTNGGARKGLMARLILR